MKQEAKVDLDKNIEFLVDALEDKSSECCDWWVSLGRCGKCGENV